MVAKKSLSKSSSNGTQRRPGAKGAGTSARSTVSGPARKERRTAAGDAPSEKQTAAEALAAALPFNANKPGEYGPASAKPQPGAALESTDPRATGSTLTEALASPKAGSGEPRLGLNPGN